MATYLLQKFLLDFASLPYLVHSVSPGKITQKLSTWLSFVHSKEFNKTKEGEKEECSSPSVCPT